jgi:hypothetical protein
MRMNNLTIEKYKPMYNPIENYVTRFFFGENLIFEQETRIPLPTLDIGDTVEIFEENYEIKKRIFGINEDAFIVVYYVHPYSI